MFRGGRTRSPASTSWPANIGPARNDWGSGSASAFATGFDCGGFDIDPSGEGQGLPPAAGQRRRRGSVDTDKSVEMVLSRVAHDEVLAGPVSVLLRQQYHSTGVESAIGSATFQQGRPISVRQAPALSTCIRSDVHGHWGPVRPGYPSSAIASPLPCHVCNDRPPWRRSP